MPVENVVGAGLSALTGWYLGAHMALTPRGTVVVHIISAVIALGILGAPYLR